MKRLVGACAAAAFAAGLAGVVSAQPPGDDNPREKKGVFKGGPGGPGQPEKADPQVEAWVKVLTDKMNDPHDAIRDSARAALTAVGPPALPALRQLAAGDDAKAFTARRLVQQIERGPGVPGMGGFGVPGVPGVPGAAGDPRATPGGGREAPPDGRRPAGDPGDPARPGGRDAGAGREAPLARVLGELNLTDQQREKVARVVEGYAAKMRDVFEKAQKQGEKLDRGALQDMLTKLAAESTEQLKQALTPEQLRRFEQLVPAGRPLFPTPAAPGGAAPGRGDPNDPDRSRTPRPERNER